MLSSADQMQLVQLLIKTISAKKVIELGKYITAHVHTITISTWSDGGFELHLSPVHIGFLCLKLLKATAMHFRRQRNMDSIKLYQNLPWGSLLCRKGDNRDRNWKVNLCNFHFRSISRQIFKLGQWNFKIYLDTSWIVGYDNRFLSLTYISRSQMSSCVAEFLGQCLGKYWS